LEHCNLSLSDIWQSFGFRKGAAQPEPPIRAELFSVERLEQHATTLAAAQRVVPKLGRGRRLTPRLYDNTKVLTEAYRSVVGATAARQSITPAAEWLLDNFHVIDEQIREIKTDLPPKFYRMLPKLADGPLKGYPRIFGIAWALVAHTDSAFDMEKLTRFVEAYQRVQPLTIGELWALAITLRITLVENLRRLADAIVARLQASQTADALADRMLALGASQSDQSAAVMQSLDQASWSTAFAVQFAQRLRDQDPKTTVALRWLNDRLDAEGTNTDEIVRKDVQRQSAMNVTVRNVIASMRLVSTINWAEFFETVSPVDAVLRGGSNFANMDFATRDLYRRAIEELSRGAGRDETEVAARAIGAAKRARAILSKQDHAACRECDPGYYLIAGGRIGFEKDFGCHVPFTTRLFRFSSDLGVISYVGMIAIVTASILASIVFATIYAGIGAWFLVALAIAGLVPASDLAVAIVNHAITRKLNAVRLPGLELHDGVPPDLRTIIVIPTLLTRLGTIPEQVERLEVHYLSNPDDNFTFALLSDWRDSVSEHAEGDDALLIEAMAGIARLNDRYGPASGGTRFFLLHRRRLWNAGEEKWIGWERKRGKLHELNRLLRGAADTTFMPIQGRSPTLPGDIRFVITLDADTRLPIGAARRLVGKMAHPLNRPVFDPHTGLVALGYGILQPRVTPSLPVGDEGSLYQRVFSGPDGLDPYAFTVSDVYQDLFEEGSYSGKGIYEVDIFEAALEQQIPENAVLSHDLLEGIFARSGFASDIEVVEEFPSRYNVVAARQHRWVRGDWQLLPWIFGFASKSHGSRQKIALPLMGRWKMLDNLRRSLSAPAALLSLLLAWLQPLRVAETWTIFIVLTITLPSLVPAISGLVPRGSSVSLRNHLRTIRRDLELGVQQAAFLITFLAHQAWLMTDAVGRTLFRLFLRRRRLLEWVTASQTSDDDEFDRRSLFAQVAASVACAAVVALGFYVSGQRTWLIAAPFGALWVLSPFIARWASLPPPLAGHLEIAVDDALTLRLIARRTWRFFEKFVTAEDNLLPPDNFQEDPHPVIAHRTSPTNMGLYLLSVVAARDFGWLGTIQMLERIEATFATMDTLERFRGHFYNWYETSKLYALEPKYVSSVDSGNLAGHLIALANSCHEIAEGPILSSSWTAGLEDHLALIREATGPRAGDGCTPEPIATKLNGAIDTFAAGLRDMPVTPGAVGQRLALLSYQARTLADLAHAWSAERGDAHSAEVHVWTAGLRASVDAHRSDFELLVPWAGLMADETLRGTEIASLLSSLPAIAALPDHCTTVLRILAQDEPQGDRVDTLVKLTDALERSANAAQVLRNRLTALADRARTLFDAMDFRFLFDFDRQLFSIGYRGADGSLDPNCYDLLASEARLASFVAIAKGDVPAKHWFHLGRTLTPIDSGSGLISWSGSMFEYLMPALVMREPAGSLLQQTNRLIVRRQEEYGKELGVPWGMSESEYNTRDIEHTYQYSSFGVPDLGYKRGLGDNIVVAPYASGLACMLDPAAAARNYILMARIGVRGDYGWYEAIDYTPERLPEGKRFVIIRAYMAHHQAMAIVGIANALHDGRMRTRFHSEPMMRAAELLLQERMPRDIALARPLPEQPTGAAQIRSLTPEIQRHYTSPHSRIPRTHLLSNGRYSVMITAAGSGYSRWRDVAITRWREDVTCDGAGAYVFLRDVDSGETWSAGYQPTAVEPDSYQVTFSEDRAEIIRNDGTLTTTLEIAVSSEHDAEVRRVSLTNHGARAREIEIASYAEIALARQPDDVAHPAFAKLFVETEFVTGLDAILATRRQRSAGDPLVWAAHLAVVEGDFSDDVQFESDRSRFLGRGQLLRSAAAMTETWPLSNSSGAVLDPIFSLRRRVTIPAGATARVAFWTLVATSRDEIIDLADKHRDAMAFERATTLAWTQAQMQRHHLGISTGEAHLFQRLANHVLFSDATLRPSADLIRSGAGKASTLWSHGISGDLPIILVRIDEMDDLELVRQLLRAHEYWRLKQLAVDLVILNDRASSYVQDLQIAVDGLVRRNQSMPRLPGDDLRGAVFALRADLISQDVRALLQSASRAVVDGNRGSLAEQINHARDLKPASAPPVRRVPPQTAPEIRPPLPPLEFFNDMGGFIENGREYLTVLEGGDHTPAPWINVIANPQFGFQVSTDGSGFTWSINSQQNQLTPWSNDPVSDPPGEAIYVRDEDSGELWGPTALPIREKMARYSAAHGAGYTRFEHTSHGIALELLQFVPLSDSIKIARLKLVNHSERQRRLSVTSYVEWVLGQNRANTAHFVITELDPQTGAIFARNPWNDQFGPRVAFADMNGQQTAFTGNRTEFIGRDGTLNRPLGLTPGTLLSNRVGAGLDPCAALQTHVRIASGSTVEVVFFLGQAATTAEAQGLLAKYREANLDAVFAEVTDQWNDILGTVQVKTPDRALDILLNRWLLYQTLACRIWARAGFYQASGAYGFRDQLQDVMALCLSRPDIARAHVLRAAGRQFVEGDVQHWWLPESGRGIRGRVTDDRVWLPYVVAFYVQVTGDTAVLDEVVPFLDGPTLREGERDLFLQPAVSSREASLFDHCALALDKSMATGAHGLPLMGAGDWNDGMNCVGEDGKGESIWLGWFLCTTLNSFALLADRRGESERAADWRQQVVDLRRALERDAWDGDWYRRAFFDDGTPLGSVSNTECRIDSIAQSWSVISRVAEPARAMRAMAALEKYLLRRDDQLSLLFTPPFNSPAHDPGYIKGYPPGIRENGGQYTHAALWAVEAFAIQGDGDKAGELLSMLNPIYHADSATAVHRYKAEPYVACADVYSVSPHVGRGGWTWYTGSAGWMYRVALEQLLGFRRQGATLAIDPCIPRHWAAFEIDFHHRSSRYHISVENPLGVCRGILAAKVDGKILAAKHVLVLPLLDDGGTHEVQLVLGET
jgi:cyclic beta-1,2-glucan synthetase